MTLAFQKLSLFKTNIQGIKEKSLNRKFVLSFAICLCLYVFLFDRHLTLSHNDVKRSLDCTVQIISKQNLTEKPRLVVCIFSVNNGFEKRKAIRNSFISTNNSEGISSFRITYKFILSCRTKETLEENMINKDIIFLYDTPQTKEEHGGEILYRLIKMIHALYANTTFMRIDDDVFLCVPEFFFRLAEVISPNMYYGWKFQNAFSVSQHHLVDDCLVILGANLVGRIANRKLCSLPKCLPDELVKLNNSLKSLSAWLLTYSDVDVVADNKTFLQFLGKANNSEHLQHYKEYMVKGYCRKNIIFHKSTHKIMDLLLNSEHQPIFNPSSKYIHKPGDKSSFESATSGSMFSGEVVRPLPQLVPKSNFKQLVTKDNGFNCPKWAVVTTIFTISTAVKHLIKSSEWCIVIVADKKTPTQSEYLSNLDPVVDLKRVKFLALNEQEKLYPVLCETIPWNSFSRKNIGYMYAIHHKATVIWDFDDDNYGLIDLTKQEASGFVTACPNFTSNVLNPYPYFGVNESRTWPRGFPLQNVKTKETIPRICNLTTPFDIGILQSLANGQPDVDAIYRLTREVPFQFLAAGGEHPAMVIPLHSFAPFNGQATLWFKASFRFIALPISVHGRVSDIWRSYLAQLFMHQKNIHLAFTPPFVFQERNPHTLIKDFSAELDLYQKSYQLVNFLSSLNSTKQLALQNMYDTLYMREYLDYSDLAFIQAWEKTFDEVTKEE